MKEKLNDQIKIVFFDIDHTLFDHKNGHFTSSSFKAMEKLHKKGVNFFLCTARPYRSMMWLGPFARFNFDGFICVNGGLINMNEKTIYADFINPDVVRKMIDFANKEKLTLEIMTDQDAYFATPVTNIALEFMKTWKETKPILKSYHDENVTSMLLFSTVDNEDFLNSLPIYWHRFAKEGIDIYPHDLKKGKGIKIVLDKLGLNKENAMAFGDDLQDISMFLEVKYGIAMGNAKEEVKKSAYYVTKSIDKDGIYHAFKHFKLI